MFIKNVRNLHDKAMELADEAFLSRRSNDLKTAKKLLYEACKYETQAADLVPDSKTSEPTRSILYRSAASLAYDCEEFQSAQDLINKGLSGNPPIEIKRELIDLQEVILCSS